MSLPAKRVGPISGDPVCSAASPLQLGTRSFAERCRRYCDFIDPCDYTGIPANVHCRTGEVRLHMRVLAYLCDMVEARLVFSRQLYVLPSCHFLQMKEGLPAGTPADPTKLDSRYFRPMLDTAQKQAGVVGKVAGSTPCVGTCAALRQHLKPDPVALAQATYLPYAAAVWCCLDAGSSQFIPHAACLPIIIMHASIYLLWCCQCMSTAQVALEDPAYRTLIGTPGCFYVPDYLHTVGWIISPPSCIFLSDYLQAVCVTTSSITNVADILRPMLGMMGD